MPICSELQWCNPHIDVVRRLAPFHLSNQYFLWMTVKGVFKSWASAAICSLCNCSAFHCFSKDIFQIIFHICKRTKYVLKFFDFWMFHFKIKIFVLLPALSLQKSGESCVRIFFCKLRCQYHAYCNTVDCYKNIKQNFRWGKILIKPFICKLWTYVILQHYIFIFAGHKQNTVYWGLNLSSRILRIP